MMLMPKVSEKTRLCGLIGDPVQHSVSPEMHNAAFKHLGLEYIYLAFRVKKQDLKKAIEGMKAFEIRGFNVTIPHKVACMELLDEIDAIAARIGAVNTIVNNDGILKGYNTDASGFLKALLNEGVNPEGKHILIVGAGGASRAIAFALAEKGTNLTIINRTSSKSRDIAKELLAMCGGKISTVEFTPENLNNVVKETDILVNTTSIGMYPDTGQTILESKNIKPGMVVFDVVYNPIKTKLIVEAEKAGAKAIPGLEMLVWQGAFAFEIWTGFKAPVDIMSKEAVGMLKKYEK